MAALTVATLDLEDMDLFAATHTRDHLADVVAAFRRYDRQFREQTADGFVARDAEDALGSLVPRDHVSAQVDLHDRVVGLFENAVEEVASRFCLFESARRVDRRTALSAQLTNDFFLGFKRRNPFWIKERDGADSLTRNKQRKRAYRVKAVLASEWFPPEPDPGTVADDV